MFSLLQQRGAAASATAAAAVAAWCRDKSGEAIRAQAVALHVLELIKLGHKPAVWE